MAIASIGFGKTYGATVADLRKRDIYNDLFSGIPDTRLGAMFRRNTYLSSFWYSKKIEDTYAGKPFTGRDLAPWLAEFRNDGTTSTVLKKPTCDECPGGKHVKTTLVHAHILRDWLAPLVANDCIDGDIARVLDYLENVQTVRALHDPPTPTWEDYARVGRWGVLGTMTGRTSSRRPNITNVQRRRGK